MSAAEDRGEANEGPEQRSAKFSEWIQRLEAQPERLKHRELRALLEKLDPDDEWVRQLKGRIDEVLEPKVLSSDAAARLARLKHHLVFEHFPRYGFRYNEAKDALVIYEPEMRVVEKIFRMAAEGLGIRAMQSRLRAAGVPTATGKPVWDIQIIRRIIASDMYRPHSFEEVSALIAPEVAARLDPHKEYGIQWYNRQRVTERTVSEPDGDGRRRYRKKRTFRWRPKEEWIAIPVPAYLPRELVDRARALVGSGRARERKHLAREWELRGMMRCGCGRKMGTRTAQSKGRLFHYYVCKRSPAARKFGECAQRCVRATRVEDIVWRFVSELLKDPDRIKAGLEELIEQERDAACSDLQPETELWEERIAECARLRSAYQDQQAAGLMTLEDLSSKLAKLEETRGVAEAELAALDAREECLRELEADRDAALLASYAGVVPEALDGLSGEGRMRVYEMLQLEVRPDPEGYEVSGAFCSRRPRGRRRFDSAKPTELRFRALLTEGEPRVRFHREGFGRLKGGLA